jgi:hypothetical protein
MYLVVCVLCWQYLPNIIVVHKGNNKITELRTVLQRESQNSQVYKQTKSVNGKLWKLIEILTDFLPPEKNLLTLIVFLF